MNNSTSSVISASANLLDPFASLDPIPPVIVTPVHTHMQSAVDTLQATDSHASLMEKSLPISNNMSDNTNANSQMTMQSAAQHHHQQQQIHPQLQQQQQPPMQPIMQAEPEQKEQQQRTVQEQSETHLPRISEAFDAPSMMNMGSDPIKAIETDMSNESVHRLEESILPPKSDDSRSQEAITANFEQTSKQSAGNESIQSTLTNNGLTESMAQNDNALQQAPETDKSLTDPMIGYSHNSNTSLSMDTMGQDTQSHSQSMPFDQSSDPTQYPMAQQPQMPLPSQHQQMQQTTVLGDGQIQAQNTGGGYMQQHPGLMQHAYPPPMSHHTEKQMLQQQLSELYCAPPTPDVSEKIKRLDDRLKLLQQHETNDHCMGGPQCVLLNPMMTAPMIESPQVSSTTGRGRSRGGSSKPRKPRQKKEKQQSPSDGNVDSAGSDFNSTLKQPTDQLPVSEDCVTQGAGLAPDDIISEMTDVHEEGSQDGTNELDTSTTADGKKPKKSGKSRSRKDGKEPRERKKRDPNDPKKKSRSRRKDSVGDGEQTDQNETINNSNVESGEVDQTLGDANSNDENPLKQTSLNDDVPDFDDIPVSKIPVKSLLEEAAKKEAADGESEQTDIETSTPKSKRRSSGGNRSSGGRSRKRGSNKSSGKKPTRSRARVIVESDGEGEGN